MENVSSARYEQPPRLFDIHRVCWVHGFICWVQYYSEAFPTLKEQLKFEEKLFRKTHKANGEGVCSL